MKLSKLKKGDIVLIKWIDSYSASRWYTDDDINHWITGLIPCISIGIVFTVDKNFVTLYGDQAPDEKGRIMSIPRGVIRKIKRLK